MDRSVTSQCAMRRLRPLLLVVLAAGSVSLTSCGDDDGPAVCGSVSDLESSISQLKDVKLGENGVAELQSGVQQVKVDLDQVLVDAKQQYAPQVDAIKSAVTTLDQNVQAARANPSASTIAPLVTDVQNLGSGVKSLQDAVSGTC